MSSKITSKTLQEVINCYRDLYKLKSFLIHLITKIESISEIERSILSSSNQTSSSEGTKSSSECTELSSEYTESSSKAHNMLQFQGEEFANKSETIQTQDTDSSQSTESSMDPLMHFIGYQCQSAVLSRDVYFYRNLKLFRYELEI